MPFDKDGKFYEKGDKWPEEVLKPAEVAPKYKTVPKVVPAVVPAAKASDPVKVGKSFEYHPNTIHDDAVRDTVVRKNDPPYQDVYPKAVSEAERHDALAQAHKEVAVRDDAKRADDIRKHAAEVVKEEALERANKEAASKAASEVREKFLNAEKSVSNREWEDLLKRLKNGKL